MRKYFSYYQFAIKDIFAYKADIIITIIANMVFFFVYFALWKSIYTANDITAIHSYTLTNTVTYYFVTSFIFRLDPSSAMFLNEGIWTGFFTNDIIKPWSALFIDVVYTLAELTTRLLLYIPFCIFIFVVASSYISLPSLPNLIYFVITVILGIFLGIAFYEIIHGLCFHYGDQDANIGLISFLIILPAGGLFPLSFLPEAAKTIVYHLPFRFLFDTPANIYLGKMAFPAIAWSWVQMILWTILFFVIFCFVYKTGVKKYTGTGR